MVRDDKGRFQKGDKSNSGRQHTEQSRKNMSIGHKKRPTVRYWLGKKRPDIAEKQRERMKGKAPWNKGKKCPNGSGEKHWNWKGGIRKYSKEHYRSLEYKKWRSAVFERDKWTCQTCGRRGCYLEAHHIQTWTRHPELRFDVSNGVTLCRECHILTRKKVN